MKGIILFGSMIFVLIVGGLALAASGSCEPTIYVCAKPYVPQEGVPCVDTHRLRIVDHVAICDCPDGAK